MTKVAFLIPTTSRNRLYDNITKLPLFYFLLPSFLNTLTLDEIKNYEFCFFIGFDDNDTFYNNQKIINTIDFEFKKQTQHLKCDIKYVTCQDTNHNPVKVWNILFNIAYQQNYEYFYQLGDDIIFLTQGTISTLINVLQNNVGVVGAKDINPGCPQNLITQSFVNTNHMKIFGEYYPSIFTNWHSDNWIQQVYEDKAILLNDILIQNAGGPQRYSINNKFDKLKQEVAIGKEKIHQFSAKKIISFSLWGDNPKYYIGAIKNAELAKTIFPNWICRFYVGKSIPNEIINRLQQFSNVELVFMDADENNTGMFWRFLPIDEDDVSVMLSRDTDSRLSVREKAAVDEWLNSDKQFHIMRDHPWHTTEILGGMWGIKKEAGLNFKTLINNYINKDIDQKGIDQNFLREVIYPIIKNICMVHDEFFNYESFKKPFPIKRNGQEFIGEIFDENDNPILAHRQLIPIQL